MTDRIINFSAGPAVLPEEVLREAQEAIWDLDGSGIGVLEHSHRGKAFAQVASEAVEDCRTLAKIPDEFAIVFVQGGASLQFAMLPANLLGDGATADYLDTGSWSKKAIAEAELFGNVHVAASSKDSSYDHIPSPEDTSFSAAPVYVHLTSNNTIFGTQWSRLPAVPQSSWIACDASSDLFSRPLDWSRCGLVYAGAQKNLGPAGATLVIIRRDLAERSVRELPTMIRYETYVENDSLYNTPPSFSVYVMGRVFKWLIRQGGLEAMARRNEEKARLLYDVLDEGDFFAGTARGESRSLMNVTFRTPTPELDARFVSEAAAEGLDGLKGHRSVGGMRASIYNAFPRAGCEALAAFMRAFASKHG